MSLGMGSENGMDDDDDEGDEDDDEMDDEMNGGNGGGGGGGRRGQKKPETEEEKRKNFLERNRQGIYFICSPDCHSHTNDLSLQPLSNVVNAKKPG